MAAVLVAVTPYAEGREGVEVKEGTHVQVEGDWLEDGGEDILVQLVQLRHQLALHLPTSWSSLCVLVGKALLCQLDVNGGDQLFQLDDEEGGGKVCQLDVEGGGGVCQLDVECQRM